MQFHKSAKRSMGNFAAMQNTGIESLADRIGHLCAYLFAQEGWTTCEASCRRHPVPAMGITASPQVLHNTLGKPSSNINSR